MSPSVLSELPLELLVDLFEQLRAESILAMGKTCRRLNTLAIPCFLERLGLPEPEISTIIRPGHGSYGDRLSGLTLNFSLVTVKQLVCVLDNHIEGGSLSAIVSSLKRNIGRIHQLVTRLSSVGSMCIVFYSVGETWTLRSEAVREFLDVFLQLLEALIQKSCTSIQILHTHSISIEPAYMFERFQGSKTQELAKFKQVFKQRLSVGKRRGYHLQGDGWIYHQLFPHNPIQPPTSLTLNNSQLSHLDLSPDFLLAPPFSEWILSIMEHSPITSLTMSFPKSLKEEEFRRFLFPRLIRLIPGLQQIKIAFSTPPRFLTTVVENIARFPLLKKITFGLESYSSSPQIRPSLEPTRLSHLVSFTGSPEQAVYLFGQPNLSYPSLGFVNIVIDHRESPFSTLSILDDFDILNDRFSQEGIQPCISMCFSYRGILQPQRQAPHVTSDENLEYWNTQLSTVSRLTLQTPLLQHDDNELPNQLDYIFAWLKVFRGLKALTLTSRRIRLDTPSGQDRRHTLLRSAILGKYPNITSFNVHDLVENQYHYHWSNARDDLERGIDGIPGLSIPRNKSTEHCICSDF